MADEKITLGLLIKTSGLEELKKVRTELGGVAKAAAKASLLTPFKGFTKGFEKLSTQISGFGKMFQRVISYRILRSAITSIIRGFREGVENLYAYSQRMGTAFNSNLDRIKESALLIKNATAAMVAPIIDYVTPALVRLADLFANIANQIGFFIAKLTGAASFSAAIRGNLSGAASAAKDLKKQVFGFDELNILNAPSGGGASTSGGGYFEEWDTGAGAYDQLTENIKAAIEAQNFSLIGDAIAAKLNDVIANLPTGSWGKWIGEKINNAVALSLGFLRGFDARKLGAKISEFVNNALTTINWSDMGALAAQKFLTIFDTIIGFVENLDFQALGSAIHDYLTGWFDEIKGWIEAKDWHGLGAELWTDLKAFLAGLDWADIAKSIFSLLGTAIAGAVSFIAGFIKGVAEDILNYFRQYINIEPEDSWLDIGFKVIVGILRGISDFMRNIWDWVNKNIVNPFLNALLKGFGLEGGESVDLVKIGKDIISSLWSGLKKKWEELKTWIKDTTSYISDAFSSISIGGTIKGAFSAIGNKAKSVLGFADGGFPDTGSLFFANEAGPELVGTIGNRTAVTSQEQFTRGLYEANMPVVSAIVGMANAVVTAINNKDTNAYLDGEILTNKLAQPIQNRLAYNGPNFVR